MSLLTNRDSVGLNAHHATKGASAAPGSIPAAAQLKLPTAFRIGAIEEDNYRTKTFVLEGELDAQPGQFVMAWLPRFDEKPFSLVNASPITLMITAVGPFTRLVHGLEVGDRLWLRGPFGRGFDAGAGGRRVALVAGGYGVAPLYWLARTLLERERSSDAQTQIAAILGARHGADLLYAERFAHLLHTAEPTGANMGADGRGGRHRLLLTTDDGSRGLAGRVTDALQSLTEQGAVDDVFACGPDAMLAAVDLLCGRFGLPAQLSWEAYMRCGVGLCGSCEHDGRLLCMDGPVLSGSR